MIQDILKGKIERNVYVNEEKIRIRYTVTDINMKFLLFSHQELLTSFITAFKRFYLHFTVSFVILQNSILFKVKLQNVFE